MKKSFTKIFLYVLGAAAVLLFTGCLDVKTVVKVNADGSGAVEQTYLMRGDIVALIAAFSPEGENFSLLEEDKLRADAQLMGEGVRFTSAVPVSRDIFEGYKVVYSFGDIGKLKLNQNPGELVPGQGEGSPKEFLTFAFKKSSGAGPAVLAIYMPKQEEGEASVRAEKGSEEDFEAAKQMFENMRIGLYFECGSAITASDASYRSGNVITLMDIDFGTIIKDDVLFKRIMEEDPATIEALKGELKGVPGLKMEHRDAIEISFR